MITHGKGTYTIEEEISGIRNLLNYVYVDIITGKIVWTKPKAKKIKPGEEAGSRKKGGYWEIKFNSKNYRRHRIIFYVAKGYLPKIVDHIKGVDFGDGIDNLQEVSNAQNVMKQKKRKDNTSGYRGVTFHKKSKKWYASISENGKRVHIGSYDSPEEASIAYEKKARQVFGDFF